MAQLHEGAAEGQQSLLAFFFSNPLVDKTRGRPEEVSPLCFQEVWVLLSLFISHELIRYESSRGHKIDGNKPKSNRQGNQTEVNRHESSHQRTPSSPGRGIEETNI